MVQKTQTAGWAPPGGGCGIVNTTDSFHPIQFVILAELQSFLKSREEFVCLVFYCLHLSY